jgi:Protein of unknown function (DUF3176)
VKAESQYQEIANPSVKSNRKLRKVLYAEATTRGKKHRLEQFWISETSAFLLGLSSFVAITAILRALEGDLQPNWRHGITINAVIAVLATTLRACLPVVAKQGEIGFYQYVQYIELLILVQL